MPSIPVDILRLILDHVDKPDLLNICLLNKTCCSCSQDILYHDIQLDRLRKGTQVCQTLAQSTHLARRVRSFEISSNYTSTNFPMNRNSRHLFRTWYSFAVLSCILLQTLSASWADVVSSLSRSPVTIFTLNHSIIFYSISQAWRMLDLGYSWTSMTPSGSGRHFYLT